MSYLNDTNGLWNQLGGARRVQLTDRKLYVSPGGGMKRLIVACDGTWNGILGGGTTNVEKLARTVQIDPTRSSGMPQVVYYVTGVGTGDRLDRMMGGSTRGRNPGEDAGRLSVS